MFVLEGGRGDGDGEGGETVDFTNNQYLGEMIAVKREKLW